MAGLLPSEGASRGAVGRIRAGDGLQRGIELKRLVEEGQAKRREADHANAAPHAGAVRCCRSEVSPRLLPARPPPSRCVSMSSESASDSSSGVDLSPLASPLAYPDCPLCLDAFAVDTAIYQTDCLHSFCADCITKHLATSAACPLCRAPVRTVTLRKRAGEPLAPDGARTHATHTDEPASALSAAKASTGAGGGAASSSSSRTRRTSKDIVVVKARYNKQVYDVRAVCVCVCVRQRGAKRIARRHVYLSCAWSAR